MNSPAKQEMRPRPGIGRVPGSIFALLILVPVLSEIGLRLTGPHALDYYRKVKLLHRYHPEYNVTLAPNADFFIRHFHGSWQGRFTANSLGFRGSPEPDPARPQIACLGDSLVMGFGVSDEETFCYQLGDFAAGGDRYQAMNLGVDAFGSLGSALRLKEAADGPGVNIKVALFFPSPNDFTIPESLAAQGVQPDDVTDSVRYRDADYKFWFRLQFEATRHSYFLMALKLSVEQLRVRQVLARQAIMAELRDAGLTPGTSFAKNFPVYMRATFFRGPAAPPAPVAGTNCPEPLPTGMKPCVKREPGPETLAPLLDVTVAAYRSMIETARRKNFQLIVVLLPIQAEELYCTNLAEYSDFFDFALRAKKFFEANKVPVIDLRRHVPRMCGTWSSADGRGSEEKRIGDFFIPGDGHLTVIGNRWAAESLREELGRLADEGRLRR